MERGMVQTQSTRNWQYIRVFMQVCAKLNGQSSKVGEFSPVHRAYKYEGLFQMQMREAASSFDTKNHQPSMVSGINMLARTLIDWNLRPACRCTPQRFWQTRGIIGENRPIEGYWAIISFPCKMQNVNVKMAAGAIQSNVSIVCGKWNEAPGGIPIAKRIGENNEINCRIVKTEPLQANIPLFHQ